MRNRIALLSDIHANLTALNAVLYDMQEQSINGVILAGDIINYGPRPNEVVSRLRDLKWPVLAKIRGNHEFSLFGGSLDHFSTDRGRDVLKYTREILTESSWDYLRELKAEGWQVLDLCSKSILILHGTLDDPFWGKFKLSDAEDVRFRRFDFVITAHSHIPHYFEHFYTVDNPDYRNRKKTVFINPGSVGQPRNHNPNAQYGILDLSSGTFEHRSIEYNIAAEQESFPDRIDGFYKSRLNKGI